MISESLDIENPNNNMHETNKEDDMRKQHFREYSLLKAASFGFVCLMLLMTAFASPGHAETGEKASVETPATQTTSNDTLRLLHWQAPVPLVPLKQGAYKDIEAARIVYEPLASFDADGTLVPILAAEIPSVENGGLAPDRTSVTWKLKQGVRWADGTPFTADDVIFTFTYAMDPDSDVDEAVKDAYAPIREVEKIDTYSVKVNFTMPNPSWALSFTGRFGIIIPRHVFQADASGVKANTRIIGTGPYYLLEFSTEETLIIGGNVISMIKAVYERNPFFREPGKPAFSRVELRGGGDAGSAAQAVLMDGVTDFAFDLQVSDDVLNRLETGGKGRTMRLFGPDVEFIALNFTDPRWDAEEGEHSSLKHPHPFFSDKRVRQAIAHAVDRDAIATLYGKAGRPAHNIVVSPPMYRSPHPHYEFDLQKAAALLDDAGWQDHDGDGIRDKNGVKLRLRYQTTINPLRQKIQDIVKRGLNSVGIEVELRAIDSSIFFNRDVTNRDRTRFFYADLQEYYTGNPFPDPGSYMNRWRSVFIPQKANNFTGLNIERWVNPEYDNLSMQSEMELAPEKRRHMFIRLNDMLVDDVVRIPLVNRAIVHAAGNTLEGIELTPWDTAVWNIKDWKR